MMTCEMDDLKMASSHKMDFNKYERPIYSHYLKLQTHNKEVIFLNTSVFETVNHITQKTVLKPPSPKLNKKVIYDIPEITKSTQKAYNTKYDRSKVTIFNTYIHVI